MPNYKTKFNKKWMKLHPWICGVDDDIFKAYCKWCKCEMKVDVRGIGAVKQHSSTAKHKVIAHKLSLKQDSTDVPSGDDAPKENTQEEEEEEGEDTNHQEENEFETHWFESETGTETDSTAATDSSMHSDQEQKHIPHLNQSISATPKNSRSHSHSVPRNERTLSVQRMKMFEAELRVWQRKGEAIVKLMETVGQDKEMWEIINKQSRLHEKERDRIREEYDIL